MSATKDENHLNPLWWHATRPDMWVLLWITRRVIRSPHWSTWACSPPDGGMAGSSQPRGIFRESPFLAEHSHSVIYITKWCLQAENAANNYTLWGLGKRKGFLWIFLCLSFFLSFPPSLPSAFITSLLTLSLLLPKSFQQRASLLAELSKQQNESWLWILLSFFFSGYKVREAYTYIRSLKR